MDLKKKLELTRKVMSSVKRSSTSYVFANQHVVDLDCANGAIAEFDRYFAAHASFSEGSKKAEDISKGDINSLKLVKAQKTYSDGFLLPDVMVGIVKAASGRYFGVTSMILKENDKDRYMKERYYSLSARKEMGAFKEMRTIFNEMLDGTIVASMEFKDGSHLSYFGDSHYKHPNYIEATASGGIAEKIKETTAKLNPRTRDEFVGMIAKDFLFLKKTARLKKVQASLDEGKALKSMRTETQKRIILANLKRKKIQAAGMSRIVEHMEKALKGEGSFAIFTSEQSTDSVSPDSNKTNYKELGKILNNIKHGAIPMKGIWEGTAEPSYFVPGVELDWAKTLSAKYNQWAFIYAGPETDGKVELWATPSIEGGDINYSKSMSWDDYAIGGLEDPQGFSESPDKKKFSFYEGKDQDYSKVVQELNNWANNALNTVGEEGETSEEAPEEEGKAVAAKKIKRKIKAQEEIENNYGDDEEEDNDGGDDEDYFGEIEANLDPASDEIWADEVRSEYEDSPAIEDESTLELSNGLEVDYSQDSNGTETIFLKWLGPLAYRRSYSNTSDEEFKNEALEKFRTKMESGKYHPDMPEETLEKYKTYIKASKKAKATDTSLGEIPKKKKGESTNTMGGSTNLTTEINDKDEKVEVPTFKKNERVYLPNKGSGTVQDITDKGMVSVLFDQGVKTIIEVNPMDLKKEKEYDKGLPVEHLDTGKNQEELHKI